MRIFKNVTNIFFIFLLFGTTVLSCCPSDFKPYTQKIFVDKVLMNESTRYTFITKLENNQTRLWGLSVPYENTISIITDVPQNERMYVIKHVICTMGDRVCEKLEIHIHDLNEIQGGGWNHGKHGKGQTTVIE